MRANRLLESPISRESIRELERLIKPFIWNKSFMKYYDPLTAFDVDKRQFYFEETKS